MRLRARPSTHTGFSLVELLVVFGVIGLLLAIVVPGAATLRDGARAVQCAGNMRQLADSLRSYAAMNGGLFPPNCTFPAPGQFWTDRGRINEGLSDKAKSRPNKPGGGVFQCPCDEDGVRSYTVNIWSSGQTDNFIRQRYPDAQLWNMSVREPSRMILLVEALSYTGSLTLGFSADFAVGYRCQTSGQRFGGATGVPLYDAGRWGIVNCELAYNRHRMRSDKGIGAQALGRLNIAYADGHVGMRTNTDLVTTDGFSTGDSVWYLNEPP